MVLNDPPQKADCILVLGGDEFGTRIVRAAELAKAGYAPYILVDGPPSLVGHESDATIQFALSKGFPLALFRPVLLPPGVDSTGTEALYVGNNILKRDHVQRILLVTSNYHTRRAVRFMRKENPWLTVIPVAAPDPFFHVDDWWKTRNGKKTFLLEWTKTLTELWGF